MRNTLNSGEYRLGWLIDDDASTPDQAVLLENRDGEVRLRLPLRDGAYTTWFPSVRAGEQDNKCPTVLGFQDRRGSVTLVGCNARQVGFTSSGVDEGVIDVEFVLLGADHIDFGTINGLRAEVPALLAWSGIRSVSHAPAYDGSSLIGFDAHVRNPDPVQLSEMNGLHLIASWDDAYVETVTVGTSSKEPAPWECHLEPIRALIELVALSSGRSVEATKLHANRGDDPYVVLTGDVLGEKWSQVVSAPRRFRLGEI